jgi:aldose 1-epimerase
VIDRPEHLVSAKRTPFDALPDGAAVAAVDLSNSTGMSVRVIALGAAIQSLRVPDRDGRCADVVLGFASPAEYLAQTQYLGATVGRYANRIARGRFELDGRPYALDTNEAPHHLHGGFRGFDKALWSIDSITSGPEARVVLSHLDADGSGGYPGELRVTAAYTLNTRNELTIEYRAATSKATIVNLTHHGYFNLAGEGSDRDVLGHRLAIAAERYTPVDATSIPTGELRRVAGTAFDFREPRTIGERIRDGREPQLCIGRGYDHNFVVEGEPGVLRAAARLEEPSSGRALDIFATAPGLQFYSGNFLRGSVVGKTGRLYRQGDGLCLEPQLYPDSPNRPEFPSARLDPHDEYVTTMALRFSTIQ